MQIKVSFADSIDKNTLGENLKKDDVDVALIDEGVFNDKDKISLIRYTQIVHTKEELVEEIGAFLVAMKYIGILIVQFCMVHYNLATYWDRV